MGGLVGGVTGSSRREVKVKVKLGGCGPVCLSMSMRGRCGHKVGGWGVRQLLVVFNR